ncbi:DUF2169 domain-containing protein [Ottowia pentelensis]|uniref:DUF2169 domain-containing protein n=1 Tax=Ottowia pentelensis TaxID=511108 RepID=A0ABV6PN34_9BURK
MRISKPLAVSVLTRPFEFRRRTMLGFSGIVFIGLEEAPTVFSETQLWPFWATRPESSLPLDECIARTRAEYLISGVAYPHGVDRRGCAVEASVGRLRKQLIVRGDRYWDGSVPSEAAPFESMPLTWNRAFGGTGLADNPVGKGWAGDDRGSTAIRWLPNIEDPSRPLTDPRAVAQPVGFGPIDPTWPQRTRYHGTYDDAWLKTQFPAIAADTDWRYFNMAPEDQQQEQPFTGVEEYTFHNMHPIDAHLSGRLPGLRVRAFVTQSADRAEKFKEIKTRLNTLWFFPDVKRAVLVFQGMHEIAEDDASDVVHLLAALEYADQPRSAQHYLNVRDKRLDKESGAIEALREEDLMPADLVVPLVNFTPKENRALERSLKRAEAERAKGRAEVARHGLDPDEHAPPLQGRPPPEIRTLDDLLRVRREADQLMVHAKARAEAETIKSVSEAKAVFEREGRDFSLIEREMAGLETRGPPKPFVDELLHGFHGHIAAGQNNKAGIAELEQMAVDGKLHAQWRSGEAGQLAAYRRTAHYQSPVDRVHGTAAQATRRRVLDRQAAGGDFRGWDLTGADLSGLDLSGADLENALMERVNLTGTILSAANLRNAVLAHADLQSTQCRQAVFANANLGAARIEKASFEGADLRGAIFAKADLIEVSWRNAIIDDVQLEEAKINVLDCGGARSDTMITFHQFDLRSFNFSQARLRLAVFVACDASGVDFSGSVFEKCAFVTLKAPGARFGGLRIDSGCFAQQCDLRGADFSGAVLPNLNFRGALLAEAMLEGAVLHGSDFSECELGRASLARADAREARFVRARLAGTCFDGANLMNAVFQHAWLEDTDFRHANLFQSDFARVRVAPGARFDGALCTRMRTLPRRLGHAPGEGA